MKNLTTLKALILDYVIAEGTINLEQAEYLIKTSTWSRSSKNALDCLVQLKLEDKIMEGSGGNFIPWKAAPRKPSKKAAPVVDHSASNATIAKHVAAEKAAEQPKQKSLEQLRKDATELGLKAARKTRDQLVKDIAQAKGWEHETPEVQAFLVNGGSVKKLPGFQNTHPKPPTQTSALKPAPKKTKVKAASKKAAKPKDHALVTLGDILEELGVEGRIARRKLRGSDIKKPGVAWEWEAHDEDIAKVKALLA